MWPPNGSSAAGAVRLANLASSALVTFTTQLNRSNPDTSSGPASVSHKTGTLLPREGTFVRAVENLGRKLILVNFGLAGEEYLFPDEVSQVNES